MSEIKPELRTCSRCHSNCTLEHFEINRKGELFKLCNNCRNRGRQTKNEYDATHKEENRMKWKEYYETNKEILVQKQKEYDETHKEEKKQRNKEYNEQNKDKVKQWRKTYYDNHKEAIVSKHSEREKAKRVARNEQLFQERPELREIYKANEEKRKLFMKYKNDYLTEIEQTKLSESA